MGNYMLFVLFLTLSVGIILASTCKKNERWKDTHTQTERESFSFPWIDIQFQSLPEEKVLIITKGNICRTELISRGGSSHAFIYKFSTEGSPDLQFYIISETLTGSSVLLRSFSSFPTWHLLGTLFPMISIICG